MTWTLLSLGVVGFAAWSLLVDGMAARFLAAAAGALLGGMFVIYSLGGHISAFRWWLGAEGERDTAKEIEQLGPEWHCEHDIEHEYGNWDHVLVGPPGVFLLDSKLLHGTALSEVLDALPGSGFRDRCGVAPLQIARQPAPPDVRARQCAGRRRRWDRLLRRVGPRFQWERGTPAKPS